MSGEQQGAQPWDPSLQAWWGWAGSAGGWALDMGHRVVQGPPNKACSPHGIGGKGPALGLLPPAHQALGRPVYLVATTYLVATLLNEMRGDLQHTFTGHQPVY